MWTLKKKKKKRKTEKQHVLVDTKNKLVFARGGGWGVDKESQKIQTFSSKINKL